MLRDMMMLMKKAPPVLTYATWNPSYKGTAITLSNGNLTATGSANGSVRSTLSKSAGKWYWEVSFSSISANTLCGIADISMGTSLPVGYDTGGVGYFSASGIILKSSVIASPNIGYTAADVLGFALDATALTLSIYKNNTLIYTVASGNMVAAPIYAAVSSDSGYASMIGNFGATPFIYTPPAGYNAGLYV